MQATPVSGTGLHPGTPKGVQDVFSVVMQGNVFQVWNPADSEEEVLVMVCRTGLNTTMGGMIRGLLAPIKAYQEKDPFIRVRHVVS